MNPITCARCDRDLLRQAEFQQACRDAGLGIDEQGRVFLRVGGLAGTHDSVWKSVEAQRAARQALHDSIESKKGFQCSGCRKPYCTDCLFTHAPAHPQGGKACPSCGGRFTYLT